jgi:hypothetical protein
VNQNAVAASPGARPGKGNRKAEKLEGAPVNAPAAASSPKAMTPQGKSRVENGRALPAVRSESEAENRPANPDEGNIRRPQGNKRGENVTRFGADTGENARDEVKTKSETSIPPQVRENEQRSNRNEEQRTQPVQEREAQQGRHDQMQNAPAANAQQFEPGSGGGPQHRERAQGNRQGAQQRPEQGPDQPKGKGKKNEGEATPPPQ